VRGSIDLDAEERRILGSIALEHTPATLREFSATLLLPGGRLKGHHYDPDSDPCQSYLIDQMDSGRWDRIYLCAPPQLGGKCWARGTRLRMADGSTKAVEQIVDGDQVMSPDGSPRHVHGAHSGHGPLYQIRSHRFEPFVVNGDHVLVLRNQDTGKVVELSVDDYLTKAPWFQRKHQLFKAQPPGRSTNLPADPYVVGAWLGDGTLQQGTPAITKNDEELLSYLENHARSLGLTPWRRTDPRTGCQTLFMTVRNSHPNPFRDAFRQCINKDGQKYIPDNYLLASIPQRWKLLAGLIDTDGYVTKRGCVELVTKFPALRDTARELAWSLGLCCRYTGRLVNGSEYWRLYIGGDMRSLPTKIPRKSPGCGSSPTTKMGHSGFKVQSIGDGEWFGFALDGDRLCLLEDYTVTHNTQVAILTPALRAAVECGLPVGYGLPTLEALDKAWAEKLKPAITGAGFGGYLPQRGPGARGGRGPTLTFQDPLTEQDLGRLVFLAGGAYGSTVAVVAVDEVDQLRKANGEPRWSDLEDMFHRADSYGSEALRIAVGTIETDDPNETIIITLIFDHGTGTQPWLQCRHCGAYQLVTGDQLRYDPTHEESVRETARIYCMHCGQAWTEDDRQRALYGMLMVHSDQSVEKGKVVGPTPKTRSLGLIWNAYASAQAELSELAVERWKAETALDPAAPTKLGNHELMRKYVRYRECRLYTGDQQDDDLNQEVMSPRLLARKSLQGWAPVSRDKDDGGIWSRTIAPMPEEATGVIRAIDVQGDRCYWILQAHDDELRTWDVAHGYEYADAAKQPFAPGELTRLWAVLDRITGVTTELSDDLPFLASVVDTGFLTDDLALWLRDHRDWRGVRGNKSIPKAIKSKATQFVGYDKSWRPGLGRFEVLTVDAREAVHNAYRISAGEPGSAHLPKGLAASHHYLRHLSSWVIEEGKRSVGERWVQKQKRDDWLDCKTYAYALLIYQTQKPKKKRRPRKYGRLN